MQLQQATARDVANLKREIEQLKVKQDQMATDNSKAIEQLKAKLEDVARQFAKVSEQSALPGRHHLRRDRPNRCKPECGRRRHRRAGSTDRGGNTTTTNGIRSRRRDR
jgi:hypothetical protein